METDVEVFVCPLCKKGQMIPGNITRVRKERKDATILFCRECSAVLSIKRVIR